MIPFRHFALPNLFLANGYVETQSENRVEREYLREDELEHCVRRLLLRNPRPLRGWDLRFLRNGLELSQGAFGALVDRDAQTVARWEKSPEAVPKFVDVMIRIRFAERFESFLSLQEVLGFADCKAPPLPNQITLELGHNGWNFDLSRRVWLSGVPIHSTIIAEIQGGYGPMLKVYEKQLIMHESISQRSAPTLPEAFDKRFITVMTDEAESIAATGNSIALLPSTNYPNEYLSKYVQ